MPGTMATYVSACSQGQCTHSAQTNYRKYPMIVIDEPINSIFCATELYLFMPSKYKYNM